MTKIHECDALSFAIKEEWLETVLGNLITTKEKPVLESKVGIRHKNKRKSPSLLILNLCPFCGNSMEASVAA